MGYDVNDKMVIGIGQLKVLISFDTLVHLSSVLQHVDRLGINFILIWSGLMVAFLMLIRGQWPDYAGAIGWAARQNFGTSEPKPGSQPPLSPCSDRGVLNSVE